jgi:hypothetical protein
MLNPITVKVSEFTLADWDELVKLLSIKDERKFDYYDMLYRTMSPQLKAEVNMALEERIKNFIYDK